MFQWELPATGTHHSGLLFQHWCQFCYNFHRWFHDGCCECVGHTCINYGINESRCTECPGDEDETPIEAETFLGEEDENVEVDPEKEAKKAQKSESEKEKSDEKSF